MTLLTPSSPGPSRFEALTHPYVLQTYITRSRHLLVGIPTRWTDSGPIPRDPSGLIPDLTYHHWAQESDSSGTAHLSGLRYRTLSRRTTVAPSDRPPSPTTYSLFSRSRYPPRLVVLSVLTFTRAFSDKVRITADEYCLEARVYTVNAHVDTVAQAL